MELEVEKIRIKRDIEVTRVFRFVTSIGVIGGLSLGCAEVWLCKSLSKVYPEHIVRAIGAYGMSLISIILFIKSIKIMKLNKKILSAIK